MSARALLPILMSPHARERLRERHPDFLRAQVRQTDGRAAAEIGEALREGRTAKRQPRWATTDRTFRAKANGSHGTALYVWPACQSRCWLIRRSRHLETGAPVWSVITVLAVA